MSKKEQTTMTDPTGAQIPVKYVPPYDRLRDKIARQIFALWQTENARLATVKQKTNELIDKLQAEAGKAHGIKTLGGIKGNIQFRSFDGSITISRDIQQCTEFDERLKLAQALISEAIAEMTEGVPNADLVEIATRAFTPRSNGNLDMQRIRDLAKLRVSHPKWKQACEIIKDCERIKGSRQYLRVSTRTTPDATPENIHLDIAKL